MLSSETWMGWSRHAPSGGIRDASGFTDMNIGGVGFFSVGSSLVLFESEPSSLPSLLKSHGLSAALFAFPFA
jgi:hypothetical protein